MVCATPKTVLIGGGMLTIVATEEVKHPKDVTNAISVYYGFSYKIIMLLIVLVPLNKTCCEFLCIFGQTLVFGGIRFEVESAAVLLFSEDTPTEFTGVNNMVRRTRQASIVTMHCLEDR